MRLKVFMAYLTCYFGASLFFMSGAMAQDAPLMRISTENNEHHVQTRVVRMFVERLNKNLDGALKVEHHHSADLFRDRDVIKAISDGKVEMAVPGTWQLDRFEPNVGIFLLPMFYGQCAAINYKLRDGDVGQDINTLLGQTIGVHVVGRWIDLGYAHLYSVDKPINTHDDLSDMRMRIPGGIANAKRLESLGASPKIIPWADLPQALTNKTVDGLLTTHATVASAQLWDKGIRYAFEDRQYFPQYVPMISQRFWNKLPQDIQNTIAQTWESIVDEGRLLAGDAQREAVNTLKENGITIISPSQDDLETWRAKILPSQEELIRNMNIDARLVRATEMALGN